MTKIRTKHPLSILHIILSLTPTNGQYNEHCLPLRHMRDISICTFFQSKIQPPSEIELYDGDSSVPGFFRALRNALDERHYDVIHVHTPHAGVLLMMGLFIFGLYRKLRRSTVHTIQNSYQNFSFRNKLLFIPSFPLFQRLVFCSKASEESFPAFLKWMGGSRIDVVQNTVDLDRIDQILANDESTPSKQFTIASVGLIDMKNPFALLEAFRLSFDHSSELILIGEGNLRPSLTQSTKEAELEEYVNFTGLIERDNVFAHFQRADLFVSTSWGEGLPVAVMEAMACHLPVILSDIPPHREIAEGKNFIPLVDPGDVAGFAREIQKIRDLPHSERLFIGQQCRNIIEEQFGLPVMHASYAEIYGEITGYQTHSLFDTAQLAQAK